MLKKWIIVSTVIFGLLYLLPALNGCDIRFKNLTKKAPKKGDIIVIQVDVDLTHRVCELGPGDTRFKTDGLKIVAATKWKEISPGKSKRKLKLKILKSGKVRLSVHRKCKKEGGKGVLTLNAG